MGRIDGRLRRVQPPVAEEPQRRAGKYNGQREERGPIGTDVLVASAEERLNASLGAKPAMAAGPTSQRFQARAIQRFHRRLDGHPATTAHSGTEQRTKARKRPRDRRRVVSVGHERYPLPMCQWIHKPV